MSRTITSTHLDERTPVLVGIGTATQREPDPDKACEPLELMRQALIRAGDDCGSPALLHLLGDIAVPKGRWEYLDPGRFLAKQIGAADARSTLAHIGVLQQTLINRACEKVMRGEVEAAAIVGGEAGHRIRSFEKRGMPIVESKADGVQTRRSRPPPICGSRSSATRDLRPP